MTFKQLSIASKETAADAIAQMAHDKVSNLTESESLSGLIAQTNAFGWALDTLEVDKDSIEVSAKEITCTAYAQFAGDQDLDRGPCGDTISGTVTIKIDPNLVIEVEEGDDGFDLEEY